MLAWWGCRTSFGINTAAAGALSSWALLLSGSMGRGCPCSGQSRHQHGSGRRFVILGTPAIWEHGPRLPLQWAVEAYRAGRSPADELIARSRGGDAVALVLVLPAGLGEGSRLPPHDELVASAM
mmetsp:Transcript_460/g.1319  ORF Transcript_460/g.1319 Transcript_460/m.1319 type:complete len:124 (+) Transcript_460:895-1266(+)